MESLLHIQELDRFTFREFLDRNPCPGRHDLGDVFLIDDRGALLSFSRSFARSFGKGRGGCGDGGRIGRGWSSKLLVFASLKNGADLPAQFHLFLAQFTSFGEILLTHSVFLVFLNRAQLLVDFLGRRRQLRVHQAHPTPCFIDQIDRFVRQEAIRDVTIAKGRCSY